MCSYDLDITPPPPVCHAAFEAVGIATYLCVVPNIQIALQLTVNNNKT